MLHKDELGEHAHHFPTDRDGQVPEEGDHWSDLNFEHGPNDPDEPGLSEAERAKRTAYLDDVWWPEVIASVNSAKQTLAQLPGGSPIKRWREATGKEPPEPHGFEAV